MQINPSKNNINSYNNVSHKNLIIYATPISFHKICETFTTTRYITHRQMKEANNHEHMYNLRIQTESKNTFRNKYINLKAEKLQI